MKFIDTQPKNTPETTNASRAQNITTSAVHHFLYFHPHSYEGCTWWVVLINNNFELKTLLL